MPSRPILPRNLDADVRADPPPLEEGDVVELRWLCVNVRKGGGGGNRTREKFPAIRGGVSYPNSLLAERLAEQLGEELR
jgi:hypothetical protein